MTGRLPTPTEAGSAKPRPERLLILGGGPAGLAAGHFARKAGMDFQILEAAPRTGGNAITFSENGLRFDSGAHRLHDRDPAMTQVVKELLGNDLLECSIPSQIYHQGRFVDFPLSPLNLCRALGLRASVRAAFRFITARLTRREDVNTFEHHAVRAYGSDIARRFLLGYSEKLWGLPGSQLCPSISGKRLKGLNLRTFLLETFQGRRAKSEHLDGRFYYPRLGFGMVTDKLAESCGPGNVRVGARVTGLRHQGRRIVAVEVNDTEIMPAGQIICTLPLPVTARLLRSALPDSIMEDVASLRFRNVVLVGLFLRRSSATQVGSIYFPDDGYPMTRVYEPRNRSPEMAPPGRTMLVAEIPCDPSDAVWAQPEDELVRLVADKLRACRWFRDDELDGGCVKRLPTAYPVLAAGVQTRVKRIMDALSVFENLTLLGRNGEFRYTHVHDMLRFGHDAIAALERQRQPPLSP